MAALRTMFWRPVNSGWKPEPSSRIEATLPRTGTARARRGDAGQDLEERALAGAVLADEPQALALRQLEGDALQRRELPVPRPAGQELAQPVPGVAYTR